MNLPTNPWREQTGIVYSVSGLPTGVHLYGRDPHLIGHAGYNVRRVRVRLTLTLRRHGTDTFHPSIWRGRLLTRQRLHH